MNNFCGKILCIVILVAVSLGIGSTYYYYSPFYLRITKAVAVIHPTKNNTTSGTVHFEQTAEGLHISASFSNLTQGNHGFHIHQWGDCSCDDAVCAGDHFNPTHQPHGAPIVAQRHIGDLGNITADEDGNALYEYVDPYATLNGPHSIIGRAVIVHADPDDFVSQPTGNAGARIGCGVIGIAKP